MIRILIYSPIKFQVGPTKVMKRNYETLYFLSISIPENPKSRLMYTFKKV
jgi:hypothetical protein